VKLGLHRTSQQENVICEGSGGYRKTGFLPRGGIVEVCCSGVLGCGSFFFCRKASKQGNHRIRHL
jgi:hypothetical protein